MYLPNMKEGKVFESEEAMKPNKYMRQSCFSGHYEVHKRISLSGSFWNLNCSTYKQGLSQ